MSEGLERDNALAADIKSLLDSDFNTLSDEMAEENPPPESGVEGEELSETEIILEDDEGESEPEPAIEPPPSWGKEAADQFKQLPRELQDFVRNRETERERYISTKANEATAAERQAREKVEMYGAQLGKLEEALAAQNPYAGIDWLKLAQTDPSEYVALKAQADAYNLQQQAVAEERKRFQAHQEQVSQAEAWNSLQSEAKLLAEKVPLFANPDQAKAEMGKIAAGLTREYGFSSDEAAGVADHRAILLIRDALAYRDAVKARDANKGKPAPKSVQQPGVSRGPRDIQRDATAQLHQKAQRGDKQALEALFERKLFGRR